MINFKEAALADHLIIRELAAQELPRAFPIVSQLRPHLTPQNFAALVTTMRKTGYQTLALFKNQQITSYAGLAICTNLNNGRHIWIYDLVTDQASRGKGYGKLLLYYIQQHATENDIRTIALSSGLHRPQAHKFYENTAGCKKVSYVYKKDLYSQSV